MVEKEKNKMTNETTKAYWKGMISMGIGGPIISALLSAAIDYRTERGLESVKYLAPSELSVREVDMNNDGKNEAAILKYKYGKIQYLIQKGDNGVLIFKPLKGLEAEVKK